MYCVEQTDLPEGVELADISVRADGRPTLAEPATDDDVPTIRLAAVVRTDDAPDWPYGNGVGAGEGRPVELTAVPYHLWANRGAGAMRVWLPVAAPSGT